MYGDWLKTVALDGNFRSIPDDSGDDGLIDLSGNDYLGLAADASLRRDFFKVHGDTLPMSASASRLLAAAQREYSLLESLLADCYGSPALLFNSGYHANTGTVSALGREGTLIVADKLVHASIIDGIVLSRRPFERFRHNDTAHLDKILAKRAADFQKIIIIVESVYSMDGDSAPIEEICLLKQKYDNLLIYVDEAHALGVCGPQGLGMARSHEDVDIIIGTFGKAIASVGAFAVCRDRVIRDLLVNSARSFIFSTALPPINIAWTRFILERIPSMDSRRQRLHQLAITLQGVTGAETPSHIQPFITGSSESAMALSAKLRSDGYKVLPIRRPTVAPSTERLRFSLSASLTPQQLSGLHL